MKLAAVVIAHDVGPWIAQALRSALTQTRPPDHVVVVENGSTDDTASVLEQEVRSLAGGPPVTLISKPPLGAGGARNLGAEIALGQGAEALAFLDGDDWWAPRFLERLSRALLASERRAAAFGWVVIHAQDGTRRSLRPRLLRDYGYGALCRFRSPMVTASALMIRSSDFTRAGGFDVELPAAMDWEICLRLTREGRSLGCARRWLVHYRRRRGQITRDAAACLAGQLGVEYRHPAARRGKHWWWLLNMALGSGDPDLVARVRRDFPSLRPFDLLSPQLVKHLLLRLRLAVISGDGAGSLS